MLNIFIFEHYKDLIVNFIMQKNLAEKVISLSIDSVYAP